MSAAIVPPQPILIERWERPRTRTMAALTLLLSLVVAGRLAADWIEADVPLAELPRVIRWSQVFALLCFIGLTTLSRYTEKPRLVIRKIPRPSWGIH